MTTFYGKFKDTLNYDCNNKTVVSMRDGVLIYLGSELGLEPVDKEFRVYRSPATIAKAGLKMKGIPITDDHVEVGELVMSSQGNVQTSDMIDCFNEEQSSTLAIQNKVTISDSLEFTKNQGKKELSLGYEAEFVPHEKYDFEQREIIPHHLAVVEAGRCGSFCSFLDSKPIKKQETNLMTVKLHKVFSDEDGAMNLSKIVEIMTALPEAIKQVPLEKVMEVLPALEEILNVARGVNASPEEPMDEMSSEEPMDETPSEEDMVDEMTEEEKEKKFGDAVAAATEKNLSNHTDIVIRALEFVDSDASLLKGKSTLQIMRTTVEKVQPGVKFTDEQIPVAFEMLQHKPTEIKDENPTEDLFQKVAEVTL